MKSKNLWARRVGRLLGAFVVMGASGVSLAAIELNPALTGPAEYTPGTNDAPYTLTVTNDGSDAETDATIATDFPGTVNVTWTCAASGTGSSCGTSSSGAGNISGGGFAIGDGGSLTFSIEADFASSMTGALTVSATVDNSEMPSVQTTDSATSTLLLESQLTLGKSTTGTTYTPGEPSSFSVTVQNAGPSDASGVTLTDPPPTGTTISGWTCAPASACPSSGESGALNLDGTLAVPAGQTATFTVTVDYPSSLTAGTSTNTATMTVPAVLNDDDGSDPVSVSVDLTRAAKADFQLAFTGMNPSQYVPGLQTDTRIEFTVTNNGPSDFEDAVLPLRWGEFVTSAAWRCEPLTACAAAGEIEVPTPDPDDPPDTTVVLTTGNVVGAGEGSGDEDLAITLVGPTGTGTNAVRIIADLQFASRARAPYIVSPSVFVSEDVDESLGNNQASLELAADRRADIQVEKSAPGVVNPGASFEYQIRVSNLGPSDIGPDLEEPFSLGDVDAGRPAETGILLDDAFDASLRGHAFECADDMAPCWRACTSDSGLPTGTDLEPGTCDPAALSAFGGNIEDLQLTLKAGNSTLIRAFVRTEDTASGQVSNVASVALEPIDGITEIDPTNNTTAPVTSDIQRSSDLSVSKTDDTTVAVAGEEHSYTILVDNSGFVTANNVVLSDLVPVFDEVEFANGNPSAGFVPGSLTYQCQAFAGACCKNNGDFDECGIGAPIGPLPIPGGVVTVGGIKGNLFNQGVDLAGRSRVEFTLTGRLDPRASGTLPNTATITPPAGLEDPVDDNNTDTDETNLIRQAAISVTKSLTSLAGVDSNNPEDPPFALQYLIEIENNGPSYVSGVIVEDPLTDDAFDQSTASWDCDVVTNPGQTECSEEMGGGPLDTTIDIDPGGKVAFVVNVETDADASGEVTNTASAQLSTGDPFFSETVRTTLIGSAELVITKTDNNADMAPGDPVTYSIKVRNEGPNDVLGATVTDEFPLVVDSLTWSCQAVTPVPGDITPLRPLVPGFTPGNGLVTSPDGRHVYVIGTSTGRMFAFDRNSVPGAGFGDVTLIETEINGVDDVGDAGAVVSGMERPLDIAISPDGLNVYALSKPETVSQDGFTEQFSTSRWSRVTQNFGCGSSSITSGSASVELNTANGCAAIFAGYFHDGADEAGTVSFDWTVDESQAHSYVARAGVDGETLQTLTTSSPANGTGTIAVLPGDRVVFSVSKSTGFGISTLRVFNFEFTPADAAPPTLAAFSRTVDPAAASFGELMFLGSFTAGLPEEPTSLTMNNGNLYVSGSGNPDNVDGEGNPIADSDDVISIFDRDPISGLPVHDFIQISDVPAAIASVTVDPGGDFLFAGGDSLQMFTIDEAQSGLPEGRLTPVPDNPGTPGTVGNLAFGTGIRDLVVAEDAPHLYGRAMVAGSPQLVMVRFLDDEPEPEPSLSLDFNYTAAGLGLTADMEGLPASALSGVGSIAISADGEHIAGVSAENNLLYILRRDANPAGGGLSLQEFESNDLPNDANSGLILATDVVFAPDGRHVLVAPAAGDENTNPALAVFNRRAPDPLFAFLENDRQSDDGVTGIQAPNDIAVSPDGAHVYSISLPDNSLTRFNRFTTLGLTDASAGLHLQYAESYVEGIGGVSGLDKPRRILVSPDGASVFVTSEANDTIAVFKRINDDDSTRFGELDFVEVISDSDSNVDGLNGAQGMAMDRASRHLYVAGSFDSAIARFERDSATGSLTWRERVVAGENGVVGLSGIRDLAVTFDGRQVLGVSTNSNALVVFDRDFDSGSSSFGELSFVQAQVTGIGVRPVALSIPNGDSALGRDAHIYVVGQNSNTVAVLRRVTDATSTAFGQVQPVDVLTSGQDGIAFMQGPSDVQVSPDGKRVYVAAEASDAVLVFDRDLNASSSLFGAISLVEVRRDSVRGVDGIRGVRALTANARNVYAAGFGEGAIASFRIGTGSVCTAGGSGTINDQVDIGVGGTIEYRATGVVRPGATGVLTNTATVSVPENFNALTSTTVGCDPGTASCQVPLPTPTGCPGGADYCATDTTNLVPEGSVTLEKTADSLSFVAGETAAYTITINNSGPSNLVNSASSPLNVSDLLDDNAAFVDGSAVWRCEATGSGSLEFLDAQFDFVPETPETPASGGPFDSLVGISGLALVPGSPGNWLVGASVLDDSLSVFTRDAVTGELLTQTTLADGDMLGGQTVDFLNGVQSVVASNDGFLYLASRVSDAVTVLSLGEDMDGNPVLGFVQSINALELNEPGLDQAVHLVLSSDALQSNVYVAGANDDAIAVFRRAETGQLTWVQSVQEAPGGVTGLLDVSHLVLSEDGLHLYALSPTASTIALFDRDADADGMLALRRTYDGNDFGVAIDGVSSAVFDADGQYLYVAAELASRIAVLERDTSASSSAGELVLRSSVAQDEDGVNGLVGVRQLAITSDAINPNNIHVYATSQATSSVAWFIRDETDGSLTFGGLRGNQSSTPTGLGGATGIVVDQALGQVIVAGTTDAALSRFQRQADSFCTASGTGELENVAFNISAGGSVTFFIEVGLEPDFTGVIDPATGLNTGAFENVATLVASADPLNSSQTSTVTSVIDRFADLAITKTDSLREINGLAGASAIAGTNTHVYTGSPDDNGIGMFARTADSGQLEFRQAAISGESSFEGINDVADLAVSTDGLQLYAVSSADNSLVTLDLDPVSGEMAFGDIQQNGVFGVSGLSGATAVAVSPDGAHVYALGGFSNAIVVFARETDELSEDFGRLTFLEFEQNGVGGVTGMGAPVALALSANGRHVYVVGEEADTLAVFERNRLEASASFGRLQYVAQYANNTFDGDGNPIAAGLGGVRDVAVSADGATVYVLGAETGTLARFARAPSTGELDWIDFIQDGGSGGIVGLTGARSILLDDVDLSLYVAGEAAAAITRLNIPVGAGELSFGGQIANGDPAPDGTVFGLEGVTDLLQSLDGNHLYATSSGRDAVLGFAQVASASRLEFQQIVIDGLGGVAPGDEVEYKIRVQNLGPSDVEARVVDAFPEGFDSVSWDCSADAADPPDPIPADCLGGTFNGDVDVEVRLPAGTSATITATGLVSASATGRLINTATISADGVQDPVIGNNSATDDDTVLSPISDLKTTVDNEVDDLTPGQQVSYMVEVENDGPSSVRGVFVEDQFPAALFDTSWSCTAVPAAGILADPLEANLSFVPAALAVTEDGRRAYAVGGNFIEVLRRDSLTGALESVQQLQSGVDGVLGIDGGTDIVISNDGRFVYAAGGISDSISLFERDATTGELTFVQAWFDGQGGIEGLGGINRMLLSSDGRHLYAAGTLDNSLGVFSIDGTDGTVVQTGLIEQGVGDVDGLAGITDMILVEDDSLLLVIADANQSLTTFERNLANGGLAWSDTLLNDDLDGTSAEDALLGAVSIIEADEEILVASRDSDLIGRFVLVTEMEDDVDTTLPRPAGAIDTAALGGLQILVSPLDLAWDSDQSRLYIAAPGEVLLLSLIADPEVVARYSVAEYPVLEGVSALLLSPSGRQLQTLGTRTDGEIGIWARERGSRCPLSGTGDLGRQQVDIVSGGSLSYVVEGTIQPNATGRLIYTVGVENPVTEQEENPGNNTDFDDDPLTPRPDLSVAKAFEPPTATVVAGLPVAWSIGVSNAGLSDAVLASLIDAVPVYSSDPPAILAGILAGSGSWSCEANTPLSAPEEFGLPEASSAIAVDTQNGFLYATSAQTDSLLVFPLLPDGTPGAPVRFAEGDIGDPENPEVLITGLGGASDVAVSVDGLHVYVTGETGNSIVTFAREESGAPLEYLQTFTTTVPPTIDSVPGLRGARSVALSSDERFVFVAGSISDAVAVFERDERSGQLSFVERVRDGIGTIVPEFNVIQGVSKLHAAAAGNDLYAIAGDSEALSRFSFNAESGVLTFESVIRAEGAIPDLAGIRDLAASPRDENLYVLIDAGIAIFSRQTDGSLEFDQLFDAGSNIVQATALLVDRAGSRAYLLDEGAGSPVIHVFRRDWSDGSLEFWYTQSIAGGAPRALVQQPGQNRLLVAGDGLSLLRFEEQALSRCLMESMVADGIDTEIDLGVFGWSNLSLDATVHPSARGTLENSVTVTPSQGADPDLTFNTATVTAPIEVVSDIAIVKTGPAEAVAGTTIVYDIAVTNAGPSDALGIQVFELAPAELSGFDWTCSATAGSTCPASGTGAPDFAADVLVGGQLDIELSATIDPAFIGELINVARLTPEPDSTDPTEDDWRSEWPTTVRAEVDVSVTKDTLTDPVVAGASVVYRVVVANSGPSLATSVSVEEFLPADLSDVTWTCSGTGAVVCPASGADAPAFTLEMPPGSSIELILEGALSPNATGTLTNTARALVGSPATDTDPSNNSDETSDSISVVPDVALDLDDPLNPFDPAGPVGMPYLATLTNAGPSTARGLILELTTSAPVTPQSPGCVNPTPTLIRCNTGPLAPGEVKVFDLVLFDLPAAPATLVIDGIVSTSGDDPVLANNVDSTSTDLINGSDLDVRLTNARTWLSPGEEATYILTINNVGSVDVPLADVELLVPVELLDPQWTCAASAGASCLPSGAGDIIDAASVPSGTTVTYSLEATVDPLIDLTVPQSVVMIGLAETSPPGNDINPVNNLAADQDEIRLVMFEDGFESPITVRSRVEVIEAEKSCFDIEIARGPIAAAQPMRILEGRDGSGRRLLWMDISRRGTQPWFQVSALQANGLASSGWLSWPEGQAGLAIRIDDRRAELHAADTTLWVVPDRVPAALSSVRRAPFSKAVDEPVFQIIDCSAGPASGEDVR